MEHCIADRLLRVAHGLLAWRLYTLRGVAELLDLRAKLSQTTLEGINSTYKTRLG